MLYVLAGNAAPKETEPGYYDIMRGIGDQISFDGSLAFPPKYFYIAITTLITLIGLLWLWRYHRQRHLRPRPWATFNQVASAMGIGAADQWLLIRIAWQQSLPTPLTLMLSHSTLHHYAHRYAASLNNARRRSVLDRASAIEHFMFDTQTAKERQAPE